MSFPEIKSAIEEQGKAFEAFKQAHDKRLDEFQDSLEELQSRGSSPGRTSSARVEREHLELFTKWIRKPTDHQTISMLSEFQAKLEGKDVTIGSGAGGGFGVPAEIAREIERLELKLSPVRRLVRILQVSTQSFTHLVNIRGATSGWVAETGTRSATVTPLLREISPTFGELYAYPQASEWSLDDVFFNVGEWLAEEVAQQFASQEGEAVIRGDGTSKPTGMLNTTPVTTADFASPLRAAAAYQFIASAASPDAILPDSLIDLVYTVNSEYRVNGSWAMNSATAGAIRKLKDSQNNYLWQPGLIAGQPDLLLGYPVAIWEQMDDVGANNFPVAFGDFRRGYLLCDRVGLRILEDRVTNPGFVRFYVRRREGGIVLNNDAIKWIRTT